MSVNDADKKLDSSEKKRIRSLVNDEMELARLEKVILGKKKSFIEEVITEEEEEEEEEKEDSPKKNKKRKKVLQNAEETCKTAAWIDEDDAKLTIPTKLKKYSTGGSDKYADLLKRQFHKNMGYPAWASDTKMAASRKSVDGEEDDDYDRDDDDDTDDLTSRCGKLLDKRRRTLPKGILRVDQLPDLNTETRCEGPFINAVEFHPSATVALVAGSSGVASIIQVGKTSNSKLQTIKFRNFPIDCARFSTDGREFVVGSKRSRSFFYYDMMEGRSVQIATHRNVGPLNVSKFRLSPDGKLIVICGRFGAIHLLSARTKEWICDLKMNTDVGDVAFSHDGALMYSFGSKGEIYLWNLANRSCVRKMLDDGCVKGSSLAFSSNGQILATGSSSGVVNLYETPLGDQPNLVPAKVIKNLVTPISDLSFNGTSEILAVASDQKKDALRLVHFPSMTVFSNFPNSRDIGRPRVANFSPSSGYFAVGNCKQTVFLYRLKHYNNY